MTHDPMCPRPVSTSSSPDGTCANCDLIALVREDTLDRAIDAFTALHPLAFDDENEEVRKVVLDTLGTLRGEL